MFLPFSDEQLQDLEQRFGRIAVVRGATPPPSRWSKTAPEPPWEVVFRAPTMGETDSFEGAANDAKSKASALRVLARNTAVGISHKGKIVMATEKRDKAAQAAWDALRDDYAGVHIAAQEQIMSLMGGAAEEQGKD